MLDSGGLTVAGEHLHHDIQVITVVLELWTLFGVEDILQHQWVQRKSLAQCPQNIYIMDAVHIDPTHGRSLFERQLIQLAADRSLSDPGLIVLKQCDPQGFGDNIADMSQAAWR